jgi:simple sugar transport system ATP-binding protein
MEPLIRLVNISKSFGEVHSLRNVNLEIGRNEIVGLLGDNGAGKSTLVKILTGYHQPDPGGEIFFDGGKVDRLDVVRARRLGIQAVYQERALADQQSLWRNIFMGRERTTFLGMLDIHRMQAETLELMTQLMGFTSTAVTPDTPVKHMSGGERQGVAITRALHFQAELLILDEPTMGLSLSETAKALDFVAAIKAAGKACLFIDHNMFHVHPVADRIVVLDRGGVAGQFLKGELTLEQLVGRLRHVAQTGTLDNVPEAIR